MPAGHMTHTGVSGFAVDNVFFLLCVFVRGVTTLSRQRNEIYYPGLVMI